MATKETKKMTARRLLSALLAAGACLAVAAPAAVAAAPALKLTASSFSTNFGPGEDASKNIFQGTPKYIIVATNVGSDATTGPLILTDTLPLGLSPVEAFGHDRRSKPGVDPTIPCNIVGQTVTCTEPYALLPGDFVQFEIGVKVAEDAPASVTNEASIAGGGAGEARTTTTTAISTANAAFDFLSGPAGASFTANGHDGAVATQAGSHPDQLTVDIGFPMAQIETEGEKDFPYSAGHPRSVKVSLPRGLVIDPTATPVLCTEAQLESRRYAENGGCPDASQIGAVTVTTYVSGIFPEISPLYNMVPPPGRAASFGFDAAQAGIFTHIMGGVNSAGEFELDSDTSEIIARQLNPVFGVKVQLWGNPTDASHDGSRGRCTTTNRTDCEIERTDTPLLTMPSSCRDSLSLSAAASDWEEPQTHTRSALGEDSLGDSFGTDGCNALAFEPTISAKPTTNLADAPTGLDVDLHVPQTTKMDELATANFKDVKVTFPPGIAVNPSGANGLGACSPAQIGLTTAVGQTPVHFNEVPASCPADAKIGTVEVSTPLLDHPLPGALYTAQPYQNPFGTLLAIYIAVSDPQTGVVSKLAGEVQTDPHTGQITTVFKDNPELPIEDVKLSLFKGPRAALKTPLACGNYAIASEITPWSTPEGATEHPTDSFQTSVAASGSGACPTSEAQAPNNPSFSAGTIAPQAGAYSPFVLKLSREDGTQRLSAIDTTLPKGLVAKLAGTSYCSEAQIAQAKSREAPNRGALERQSPSCPASSEVGTVNVGAGAGITPFYAQGKAYLAGPYKGAPLSLVIITPAVAGPYDLGAVLVRTALYLNSETAQVHAVSDPLPTILDGIPLDVRSIALKLDRPSFTLNPTSCDPTAITGSALAATAQSAALSSPFQVGGCSALGFKPKLALSLKGSTKRTGHPALKGVVSYPRGSYANVASAQITLPHSAFLDQAHIKTICTRVQFAIDACPPGAIYGFAKATTPLLDNPVEGPVYLRSSSHKLPDLVLALHGQIDADAVARVDTGKGNGIRVTFEAVPDVPLSKVVVEMKGGSKGLLVNSENICSKPQKAIADFTAQNGKTSDTTPTIANSCKGKAKKKKHKAKKPHKNHRAQR